MARYGRLPEEVLSNPRIGFVAKAVYAALAMYRNGRTGQCNPRHAALCELLRVKETALKDALRALDNEGEIVRHYEPGKQTWYALPRLDNEAGAQAASSPSTQAGSRPSTPAPNRPSEGRPADPRGAAARPPSYTMTEQTKEQTREQTYVQTAPAPRTRVHGRQEEPQQQCYEADDDPKVYARWLNRSDRELGLLPALPGFDAAALVARWTRTVAPRLWRRDATLACRVFEVIHRHPRFAQPRQFEQGELERLVDEATKHRAGKPRLATDPFDLLARTPAGRARFQSILLFSDHPPANPAHGTDSQVLLDRAIADAKRMGMIKP